MGTGTQDLTVRLTDSAGNVTTSGALPVVADYTAPTVALAYSDGGTANLSGPYASGNTVTVTATFSEAMTSTPTFAVSGVNTLGAQAMTLTLGSSVSIWTYAYTVASGDGTATVAIVGTDLAGNTNATATSNTFEVDSTAPAAATSLVFTATGGTVLSDVLNATNTGFSVAATVVAGDVGSAGGTAELLVGETSFSPEVTASVESGTVSVDLHPFIGQSWVWERTGQTVGRLRRRRG